MFHSQRSRDACGIDDSDRGELVRLNNAEPDSCVCLDLLLEIRCELLERLGRDDG